MLRFRPPEDVFQGVVPGNRNVNTAPLNGLSKYDKPCRHGSSCVFRDMGKCFYYHDFVSPPKRIQLMMEDLSGPVALPAFGDVDTMFQWYGVRNAETLASFNVLADGRLAIPGFPPALRRPTSDITYTTSDAYLPNPHRSITPKFNPLLRALHILQPNLDPSSLSIITTAGCLRRIASFLSGDPRTERLDIEFRDGTLFVGSWEGDPLLRTYIGYGKQFEEGVQRYSPQLKESVSSHIVAGYEMAGLRLGVQVEVDAFECRCHSLAKLLSRRETPKAKQRLSGGRFSVLSDGAGEDPVGAEDGILRVGAQLPLSCAVEIKTRKRDAPKNPYLRQLYFQQTPRVFVAIRDERVFRQNSMRMHDKRKELGRWEAENQDLLGRLVALLKTVRSEAVRRAGDRGCKMGLVLEGGPGGSAILYKREGEDLVSDL